MVHRLTVVGVFSSPADAQEVRAGLIATGADESSVVLSRISRVTALQQNHPGSPYENQPGQRSRTPAERNWLGSLAGDDQAMQHREAQHTEAAMSASCIVSADAQSSGEARRAHAIMRRHGARKVYERHLMSP